MTTKPMDLRYIYIYLSFPEIYCRGNAEEPNSYCGVWVGGMEVWVMGWLKLVLVLVEAYLCS